MSASIKTHPNKRLWYVNGEIFESFIRLCVSRTTDIGKIVILNECSDCRHIPFYTDFGYDKRLFSILEVVRGAAFDLSNDVKLLKEILPLDSDILDYQRHFLDLAERLPSIRNSANESVRGARD